jgi:hypothetical protein
MSRGYIWFLLALLLLGALFASASVHAATIQTPSICADFTAAPTFASVNAVMQSLIDNGHTVDQAANILVATVEQHCPQHIALLQAYVDAGVFLYPELTR